MKARGERMTVNSDSEKPYDLEPMENKTHKCTACSCEYTDDEGGVQGDFGILSMSFCPTCLSCMLDMAEQLNPREWVGLTDEELCEIVGVSTNDSDWNVYKVQEWLRKVEAKLKDKNNG